MYLLNHTDVPDTKACLSSAKSENNQVNAVEGFTVPQHTSHGPRRRHQKVQCEGPEGQGINWPRLMFTSFPFRCPTYRGLPSHCKLIKPPGKCCAYVSCDILTSTRAPITAPKGLNKCSFAHANAFAFCNTHFQLFIL